MSVHSGVRLSAARVRLSATVLVVASTCLPWFGLGGASRAWGDPASAIPSDSLPKADLASGSRPVAKGASSPGAETPAEAIPQQPDQAIPAKIFRYSERLLRQSDSDGDGRLNRREWGRIWGFLMADANADGVVDLGELVRRVASYGRNRKIRLMDPLAEVAGAVPPLLSPGAGSDSDQAADGKPPPTDGLDQPGEEPSAAEASEGEGPRRDAKFFVSRARLPEGLPGWFLSRDADGDGQLTMAEYAPKATRSELVEFARYDADGDGVITAKECVKALGSMGEKEE